MQPVLDFGRSLVESKDLDPVYCVLYGAGLGIEHLKKWLLAYWCFYDAGTASKLSENRDYWVGMREAAGGKEWSRGSERRHFRGNSAKESVSYLEFRGLNSLWEPLFSPKGPEVSVQEVMEYVKTWVGFGPWIAFKVADMVERLGLRKVSFEGGEMFLFDSPKKGAELVNSLYNSYYSTFPQEKPPISPPSPKVHPIPSPSEKVHPIPSPSEENYGRWAVDYILDGLGNLQAPPRYDRGLNCQEAETILCKFKSHVNGRYEVGCDIKELRKSLLRFARCRTSQRLLLAGKECGMW